MVQSGTDDEYHEHFVQAAGNMPHTARPRVEFFQRRAHLWSQPLYRAALLQHLPRMIREESALRGRIERLPEKIRSAILASEIASSLVYLGDRDSDYAEMVAGHLQRMAPV